mmetsp:Transcript_6244/g.13488  ORF Transcript_6244/g.13488 Transcript_6244/m.13488 type:complete len:254 (+) Transcript_6244:1183-1944(+)
MRFIPKEESARYGDRTFALIMIAKVVCVQLVNELGYDLLFTDIDVVFYRDPMEYFRNPTLGNFDVYFQDDGSRQERYAPYSANSGFYFIRSNERSKILFRSMMYSGDIIIACRSHQQVLIALLEEYNSLFGLTVKVLSREEDDFPGGYHYHMRKDIVKKMVNGEIKPYIFHMSWTLNKVNKLEYMKQMGMWFVKEQCIGKQVDEIFAGEVDTTDNTETCCSAEPIIQCFYRDKPSVVPCRDAPAKDSNGQSFW